jgi:hypothetical protein
MRGHLFAGRYKALLVDGSEGFYFRTVCDYVHLNPARARIVDPAEGLESYPWSSYPAYLQSAERPAWLRVDRLLGEHGIPRDDAPGRAEFSRRMETRRSETGDDASWASIRRGWRFGAEDFLERLQERLKTASRDTHEPCQVKETMQVKARRLIKDALNRAGLVEMDLPQLRKGASVKVEIARELRAETTLTLREIAEMLHAGSWRSLANALSKAALDVKK